MGHLPTLPRRTALAVLILFIAASQVHAQDPSGATGPAQEEQNRSFYYGKPVADPSSLSGIWEAPDGHGGAIGLHLMLDTAAPADATTLDGATQTWLDLQAGMYQRTGAVLQIGEQSYFVDDVRGGSLRYDDGRLTLHTPGFDLDLLRSAEGKWTGRFHRRDFDEEVTLSRPGSSTRTREAQSAITSQSDAPPDATWLVGTWRMGDTQGQTCVHIAEQAPGELTAWSDNLQTPGPQRCPSSVKPPEYAFQHFGELAKVTVAPNNHATIELYAFTPICCPHSVSVSPAGSGAALKANWLPGFNQMGNGGEWIKMPANTCIVPNP